MVISFAGSGARLFSAFKSITAFAPPTFNFASSHKQDLLSEIPQLY
jgi:hypothetical protein